jgi:hypothetical protein
VRVAHLSDLHLGFRQYQRVTERGINQREEDVARAFQRAIDLVLQRGADLVVVAGDVFHQVRPGNTALLHAYRQFARLRAALPDTPVVLVAGNHDTPRASETVCILRLFEPLGCHVVEGAPRRLEFPERELAVLAVPDGPALTVALAPAPGVRFNVLVAHAEVEGVIPESLTHADRAGLVLARRDLEHPGWDYVALGHYHVHTRVGERAWYSGSLDFVSNFPWGELWEEQKADGRKVRAYKGYAEHDLATGKHEFVYLTPVKGGFEPREFLELDPIDARGLGAPEVDALVAAHAAAPPRGIDDRVVRLVVRDIPRHVSRELDARLLRDLRRRTLHLALDLRRPERVGGAAASGAPGRRRTLADLVREAVRARDRVAGVDPDRLEALALAYLAAPEGDDA